MTVTAITTRAGEDQVELRDQRRQGVYLGLVFRRFVAPTDRYQALRKYVSDLGARHAKNQALQYDNPEQLKIWSKIVSESVDTTISDMIAPYFTEQATDEPQASSSSASPSSSSASDETTWWDTASYLGSCLSSATTTTSKLVADHASIITQAATLAEDYGYEGSKNWANTAITTAKTIQTPVRETVSSLIESNFFDEEKKNILQMVLGEMSELAGIAAAKKTERTFDILSSVAIEGLILSAATFPVQGILYSAAGISVSKLALLATMGTVDGVASYHLLSKEKRDAELDQLQHSVNHYLGTKTTDSIKSKLEEAGYCLPDRVVDKISEMLLNTATETMHTYVNQKTASEKKND